MNVLNCLVCLLQQSAPSIGRRRVTKMRKLLLSEKQFKQKVQPGWVWSKHSGLRL
jgi:hypothetical protein